MTDGILISLNSTNITVKGNYVGANKEGLGNLGNGGLRIRVLIPAFNNIIIDNIIANNVGGLSVNSTGNIIQAIL